MYYEHEIGSFDNELLQRLILESPTLQGLISAVFIPEPETKPFSIEDLTKVRNAILNQPYKRLY